MRVPRLLPPVALALSVAVMVLQWDFVAGAYRTDGGPTADIQLSGLDLGIEPTPIEPSPYRVFPAPDTRGVAVELAYGGVESVAAPTISGGAAVLTGVVQGPTGPADGAVVRLERHTDAGVAVIEVVTNELGRWTAPNLLGGRYRVRAWLVGQAAMAGSEVFFLAADETRTLPLALEAVDTTPRMRFTHRGDIFVGLTGTVGVSVTVRTVDDDGFVVTGGLAGAIITLTPSGPTMAVSSATVTADGDGVARFVLTCVAPGTATAVIVHQDQAMTVDLPACVPPPPPPTTAPPVSATPSSTPPTTVRPGATTTRPGTGATRG